MAVDEAAYRRLVEMGRRNGILTLDQIGSVLPVRSMSDAELAETVDRLERDGITVEVDEALQRPRRGGPEEVPEVPIFNPPTEPAGEPQTKPRPTSDGDTTIETRRAAQPATAPEPQPAARSFPTTIITVAAIAAVLLILLVFLIL